MANNRMYLVNKDNNYCVCIAVHFGGKWKPWTGNEADHMYQAFADELGVFYSGWPSQSWVVEYEHADDRNPGPEHDWKTCLTCTQKYVIGQSEMYREPE